MCCAQTAAPEGEKMIAGERALGFSAAINAVRKYSDCSQQACSNLPQKGSQTHPRRAKKHLETRSGEPLRAKMRPRDAQDQPEGTQERPRSGQEAPKGRPRAAKRRPRAPKRCPSDAREAPSTLQK